MPKTSYSESQGTADEYARDHCCFHDHRHTPFRFKDQIYKIQTTARPVQSDGLVHQSGLVSVPLPLPDIKVDMIDESDQPQDGSSMTPEELTPPPLHASLGFSRLKGLYLPRESLDLGYDAVKEIQQYSNDVQSKRGCNLSDEWLPLSPVDIEKDEGLPFSSASSRWQSLALHALNREDIETPDEAKKLILDAERLDVPPNDQKPWMEAFSIKKISRPFPEPVSPPMSPITDAGSDFIPAPHITIIDLTSEPSSPVNSSINHLQQSIENGCLDSEPAGPSTNASSPLLDNLAFTNTKSRQRSGLKVDVPMVLSSSPGTEESSCFLSSMMAGKVGMIEHLSSSVDTGSFFDDALMDIVEDRHYHIMQMVEEERPNQSDSLLRVQVPVLSFELPAPEYGAHLLSSEVHFAWLKSTFSRAFQLQVSGSSTQLGSSLKWTPVPPGAGRLSLEEDLGRLRAQSREYLTLEHPRLCSADYVSKEPSLRVIRLVHDEEMEEDGDEAQVERDDPSIAREVAATTCDPNISKELNRSGSLLEDGLTTFAPLIKRKTIEEKTSLLPNLRDSSATSRLLSSFMELRQPKKRRYNNQSYNNGSVTTENVVQPQPPIQTHPVDPVPHEQTIEEPEKAPAPDFVIPQEKCRFLVSLSLNMSIISRIEKAWPQVELVDRDFTQYNTLTWSPGSAQRQEVISCLAYEADLVLSPSAGIIMTTLLKVKQKPLPGSSSPTPLRDRIQRVSEKYESLFILVSEANPVGEYVGNPSDSDLAAFADFVRFTIALQAGVVTHFIPGAEETLTKWVLSLMCSLAPQASDLSSFLDSRDTTWSVFFRRAGMNIYAAQVLAGTLLSEYGKMGLVRFLAMSTEERITRYGQMMGGQTVLGRICKLIDREWM